MGPAGKSNENIILEWKKEAEKGIIPHARQAAHPQPNNAQLRATDLT